MYLIEVSNRQTEVQCDDSRLRRAVEAILRDAGCTEAEISIAIVDDRTIHNLNRQYLNHDCPTDVLSFVLSNEGDRLEGEVIASIETAARVAEQAGWSVDDELLLYVIHGALHLVGQDDDTQHNRAQMRASEGRYLAYFGLQPHLDLSAEG